MLFTYFIQDNILFIKVTGDLTGLHRDKEILKLIHVYLSVGTRFYVVDLSGVTYMNSTGLSIFIQALNDIRAHKGGMVFLKPAAQVEKILLITKLNNVFWVASTRHESIKVLSEKCGNGFLHKNIRTNGHIIGPAVGR